MRELKYLHREFVRKQCNGCTACCHVMQIDELDKAFKTDCINQCNGCKIYDYRPQPCIDFECLWLQGWAGYEQHRPSTCGVMYTGFKDNLGDIISAWELWPGAFDYADNREMIAEIALIDVIILRDYHGKISFRGKKDMIREFLITRGTDNKVNVE